MPELTDEARRLLGGAHRAHLATLLPDGSPHSVPLWIGLEGDQISFQTSPNSRKARNVARDPRVAVSVIDRDDPHRTVLVRGRVVEQVDGDRGWAMIDRMSQAYLGMPYPVRADRVAYLIEPEYVRAIAF